MMIECFQYHRLSVFQVETTHGNERCKQRMSKRGMMAFFLNDDQVRCLLGLIDTGWLQVNGNNKWKGGISLWVTISSPLYLSLRLLWFVRIALALIGGTAGRCSHTARPVVRVVG